MLAAILMWWEQNHVLSQESLLYSLMFWGQCSVVSSNVYFTLLGWCVCVIHGPHCVELMQCVVVIVFAEMERECDMCRHSLHSATLCCSPPPPRVSDPDMHHDTCVTHVLWCMSGSLTSRIIWSWCHGKRFRHSWRMRKPQFCVSGKRPMILSCNSIWCVAVSTQRLALWNCLK